VKYSFIKEHGNKWSVSLLTNVLSVSRSAYYAWLKRAKSKREIENEELLVKINYYYQKSRRVYGSPRIHKDLREAGYQVGENRVAKLMRKAGIRAKSKRKYKTTTKSKHKRPKAANLLKQNFKSEESNKLWAADISYIDTREGWLYLAVVLDLFSRKVIGWSFSERLKDDITVAALNMAIKQRLNKQSMKTNSTATICHSDQGSQYASKLYLKTLKDNNLIASMSDKGNCYDNAVLESFFASLKTEEADKPYNTRQEAKTAIFDYIESFYNNTRRHSSLDYLSPDEYERRYNQSKELTLS
jgi:transposase InsO family protein